MHRFRRTYMHAHRFAVFFCAYPHCLYFCFSDPIRKCLACSGPDLRQRLGQIVRKCSGQNARQFAHLMDGPGIAFNPALRPVDACGILQPHSRVIYLQPVPGQRGKRIDPCHFCICICNCHFFLPASRSAQPIDPFISSLIRLFISTAYSRGSSLETLSANPLTIMALASSSLIPRDIR